MSDADAPAILRQAPVEVTLPPLGVFLLESHHGPGFRMPASRHDFLEVFYVLRGRGRFVVGGEEHAGRDGDLVVVPVGARHRIEDDPAEPLALYGVCVAPSVWAFEPRVVGGLPAGRLPISRAMAASARSMIRRLLFEQTADRLGSRMAVLGLTQQLLANLARAGAGAVAPPVDHREAVDRYVAALENRFFEPADLDTVAASLDMSRRQFTGLFRARTGASWADHVATLRVHYAQQLLDETPKDVVAIAFEAGFEDLSSFYRAFKKRTGLAPNQYRKRPRDADANAEA